MRVPPSTGEAQEPAPFQKLAPLRRGEPSQGFQNLGASLLSLPSFIWTWREFCSAGGAPCTASPKVGWALREANLDPCVARILQPPGPDARSWSSTEVSGGLRDIRPL